MAATSMQGGAIRHIRHRMRAGRRATPALLRGRSIDEDLDNQRGAVGGRFLVATQMDLGPILRLVG
jgi:hypothetical protein